jgi:hypothetical protein
LEVARIVFFVAIYSAEVHFGRAKQVLSRRDARPVRVRTLILWEVNDVALSRRMARPSLGYCEDGNLIFFPEATRWVQHEEVNEVNRHLLQLVLG